MMSSPGSKNKFFSILTSSLFIHFFMAVLAVQRDLSQRRAQLQNIATRGLITWWRDQLHRSKYQTILCIHAMIFLSLATKRPEAPPAQAFKSSSIVH